MSVCILRSGKISAEPKLTNICNTYKYVSVCTIILHTVGNHNEIQSMNSASSTVLHVFLFSSLPLTQSHQYFLMAASAKGDRTHELRSATRAKSEGERDQ